MAIRITETPKQRPRKTGRPRIKEAQMNTLIHRCQLIDGATVETIGQLKDAIREMIGTQEADDETYLDKPYRVQLWAETLSDGSTAYSVRIGEAAL